MRLDVMRKLLLAIVLLGCGSDPKPSSAPRSDDDKQLELMFKPPGGDPISCKRDDDCHPPPCGPCTAGTVITTGMLDQECVVNPCKNPAAKCTSSHVCAVR
jgi:hypothetical protein